MIEKYFQQFKNAAMVHGVDVVTLLTIGLNESSLNPAVQPFFEKTWKYFTTPDGKPLFDRAFLQDHAAAEVQAEAAKIIGEHERDFQGHAHGIMQTVGSVLRELGYQDAEPPKDVLEMCYYGAKHVARLSKAFERIRGNAPTILQQCAMYNGGLGAVTDTGWWSYVDGYVEKSKTHMAQVVDEIGRLNLA